jgi:hypothetical protein
MRNASSPLVGSEAVAEGQKSAKSISAYGGLSATPREGDGAPRGVADWRGELGEGVFRCTLRHPLTNKI